MNIIDFLDSISQRVYDDNDLLNQFVDDYINNHDIVIGSNGHGINARQLSTLPDIQQHFYKQDINYYIHEVVNLHFLFKESYNDYTTYELLKYIQKIKSYSECGDCGTRLPWYFDFETNTLTYENTDECSITEENKKYSITLDVPCGKLLIANDLRSIFTEEYISDKSMEYYHANDITGYISVNYTYGRIIKSKMMETMGLMFFLVGNDCPWFYQNGNRIIFRDNYEDMDGHDTPINLERLPLTMDLEKEKHVGSVCTDTWAISAMSYTKFKEICDLNGKDIDEEIAHNDISIVDVEPGTYKCTCVYELMDSENLLNQYAEIVKV